MCAYRRASVQAELGRRRSSGGASYRRYSAASSFRGRLNSASAADGQDIRHPPASELAELVPGLPSGIDFEPTTVPPPPTSQEIPDSSTKNEETIPDEAEFTRIRPPSKVEIREALSVSLTNRSLCFCGLDTTPRITLTDTQYSPAYRYILETFTEKRQLRWDYEPYSGDPLDEPSKGAPPPQAWDIVCNCPCFFQNSSVVQTLPHTEILCGCLTCGGKGSRRCILCNAAGWDRCSFCLGAGYKITIQGYRDRCHVCLGSGQKKCWRCAGEGIAMCRACEGTGQTVYFVSLAVSWCNHVSEQVTETGEVVQEKIKLAPGHKIFYDCAAKVSPISNFAVAEVNGIASGIYARHSTLCASEKLLMQRQQLQEIPLTCVTYQGNKSGNMKGFVYGAENAVFVTDEETACCKIL